MQNGVQALEAEAILVHEKTFIPQRERAGKFERFPFDGYPHRQWIIHRLQETLPRTIEDNKLLDYELLNQ